MSDCILKSTKCDVFCSFETITSYCFDCPALMCNKCKDSMHINAGNKRHEVISFQNDNLNWNNKQIITSIFDDQKIAVNTFFEVSRNIDKIVAIDICIPEGPTWTCESCTYNNQLSAKKCNMCYMIRKVEEGDKEYDSKLEYFQLDMLKQFIDLDKKYSIASDIPFENIIYSYTRGKPNTLSLSSWHNQYYPQRKYLNIINDIIEEAGFSIGSNELDRRYNAILKQKNQKFLGHISNVDMVNELTKSPELLNSGYVNKYNNISTMLDKIITDSELWKIIIKNDNLIQREKRILQIELDLQSQGPLDLLRTFIKNDKLGEYLKESCPNGNIKLHHIKQAITDQVSIDGAMNFLRKSCELCCDDYPMPEICGFITCSHEFCRNCVLNWLVETIEKMYPVKWNCPACPDEKYRHIDKNLHYAQLRGILSENKILINVFETKLLQEQLMKSPNFHWCANEECPNGFEAEGNNKIVCPLCKSVMCVNCNRKWQEAHEDKTCQEFELWMLKNDPNLSKLLKDIGIECPNCGMRYALAAGGCLHFDCKACGIKFCGGCDQLFVDKCDKPKCTMSNFHSHHPRNCLYFLRDQAANELENMLKDSDYPKLQGKPEKMCQFMIANEQMKDVVCNKEVYATTAMCEQHYKEYLVQFINRYKIDPADFSDSHGLNMMLFQMVIDKLDRVKAENEAQFKERLKKTVKESCLFYIPKGLIEAEPVQ